MGCGRRGAALGSALPPLPLNLSALERALERANEFNGDRTARVLRIDEKDVEAVASISSLRVRQRREQYLYDPQEYENLGGSRYRTLRRQVAQFETLPDTKVAAYSQPHKEACLTLLRRWQDAHREAHGSAGGASTTRRAIELTETLEPTDLRGELTFCKGELVAIAFGGEIRQGVACFFDAKSAPSIPGLSYAHRRNFLIKLRDFERVNDGSDTGRSGLRQLKQSLRPVAMHTEHRARQE